MNRKVRTKIGEMRKKSETYLNKLSDEVWNAFRVGERDDPDGHVLTRLEVNICGKLRNMNFEAL